MTKKEFQNIINESIPGFKPHYVEPAASTPSTPRMGLAQTPKPITKADIASSVKRPTEPDYDKVELVNDPKLRSGKEWAEKGGNFPIKRNGKIYYVSRSVAVSMYAYCKDSRGMWCVLANQRGPGAPNNVGKWNVPCGYLDYGEDALHASIRECFEETGVKIPEDKPKMMGVNSTPNGGSENVSIRFACVLDGTIDDYPTSDANCEPGEVTDIQWIPLSNVKQYQWAFGMWHKVIDQAKTSLSHLLKPNGIKEYVQFLRNEIRNNPRANILLDKIIEYYGGLK